MARRFVLALAACVALLGVVTAEYNTKWSSFKGANFDVSPLTKTDADYILTAGDIPCTPETEKNYTYVFNVAADVYAPDLPSQCSGIGNVAAVQYDPEQTQGGCYSLGLNQAFSLVDTTDPSKGVAVTYTGGDQCNHGGTPGHPLHRQITLVLSCADVATPSPQLAYEPAHCVYTVTMPTVYGCPVECPIGGESRRLCGGHGICGYDQTNSVAKCFCDTGYGGLACDMAVDASTGGGNGAVIGLLVTVLIIAAVLGVGLFFVVRMLRAYRQDAHNYMAMHQSDLGAQDI